MEDRAMKRHFISVGVLFGAASLALTYSATSSADTTVVAPQPAPAQENTTVVAAPAATAPAGESHDAYTGPNRRLIATGLLTFGLTYIPSIIVAGTSDTSADHHLYVPIVGPWLDLGDRPGCGPHIGCDTETTNKVLLVFDGIFQGIGALTTVYGFLSPERHEVVTTSEALKPTVHVAPANVASGYGLAAVGSF
jgi:hypothetical protein